MNGNGGAGRPGAGKHVLLLDNYDSFTWNLYQLLGILGAQVDVVRNDAITVDAIAASPPDAVVISPGPSRPEKAGICVELVQRLGPTLPMLGVCLGHQAMVEAFGGRVVQGEPVHGKDAEVTHDGRTIYTGLPSPLVAGRYHSLVADPDLPEELELTASLGEVVMGARHRELPAEGVQFHPESVLTPQGKSLLANFLQGA